MRKNVSTNGFKRLWMLMVSIIIMGLGATQAQTIPFESGFDYTKITPAEDGYVLVTFDSPVDMTGATGIFYTCASYGADETLTAVACDGQDDGPGNVSGYGPYEMYTNVTKVVYQVTGGNDYCVWNSPVNGTMTFSTTMPNINGEGGGEGGGDVEPAGDPIPFETGFDYVKITPPQDGYVLVEFDSPVDMTGAYGVFYTCASYGADETLTAVACNGQDDGPGNVSGYGPYEMYTNVTKVVYQVTGGNDYCVWNTPAAGTMTFYTSMPNIDGSGGGGDDQPTKKVIYVCVDDTYPDPERPLVVELGDDGTYTFEVQNAKGIRMSTTKSTSASWNGFEVGEFNMTAADAADRKVSETMLGRGIMLWEGLGDDGFGAAGWLQFPWTGNYKAVIPSSLATITLTALSEKPSDLMNYVVDPTPGNLEAGFGGVVLVWPDGNVVIPNTSQIYVTNPDPNGQPLTVANGAIEITYQTVAGGGIFAEGDDDIPVGTPGNAISIDMNPESEYYDPATGALINPLPTPAQISVVIPAGALTVNDEPTTEQIVLNYTIPAGDGDITQVPVARIIVPTPDSEAMAGFQWVYGTQNEAGAWISDYLSLEMNENYEGTPRAKVNVPNSTSTFDYRIVLSDNIPSEEPGYSGPATSRRGDNTGLLLNFFYNQNGIWNTWQKEGDYTVTIPAGAFWITLWDENGNDSNNKVLNPETVLVYHCLGKHDLNYGSLQAPKYTAYVPEVTANTNFGIVDDASEVIVSFPTYHKDDVPTPLTKGTGEVTVSLNGAAAVSVPFEVVEHYSDELVNGVNYTDPGVKIDLSQFNNAPGTYKVTLPEGLVYSAETDFQNNLYNLAQTITFELEDQSGKPNVTLAFDADAELIASGDIKLFGSYDDNTGMYSYIQKVQSTPVELSLDSYSEPINIALVDNEDLQLTVTSTAPDGSWEYTQAPAGTWQADADNGTHTPVWTITLLSEEANNATFTITIGDEAGEEEGITLNFTGVEDAYSFMQLYNGSTEEVVTLTDNQIEFIYDGLLILSLSLKDEYAAAGYTFEVVSNLEQADGVWQNMSVGTEDVTQAMLGFWEGAKGNTFDVVVTAPTVTPEVPATVVSIDPENNTVINLNADGSATVTIEFSEPVTIDEEGTFVGIDFDFSAPGFYKTHGKVDYEAQPGSDNKVWIFTVPAEVVAQKLAETPEGADQRPFGFFVVALNLDGTPVEYDGNSKINIFYENAIAAGETEADGITLNFTGVEDAYAFMQLYNGNTEELETLTDNQLEIAYDGMLILSLSLKDEYAAAGYTFEVVSNLEQGEGLWQNLSVGTEDVTQAMLGFWEGAKGNTFDVVVTAPTVTPGTPAEVVSIDPENNTVIYLNADGSATVTIEFSEPVTIDAEGTFVGIDFDFSAPGFYKTHGKVDYEAQPGSDNKVWIFTVPAEVVAQKLAETPEGADQRPFGFFVVALNLDGTPVEYDDNTKINIYYENAIATGEPAEEYSVTLNFAGVADAYAFLQAYNVFEEEEIILTENTLTLSYVDELRLNLALKEEYAEQGYTFYITSNLEEGVGIWSQQGVSADNANQIMVAFWEGANGTTFDVVVVEPSVTPEGPATVVSIDPENGSDIVLNADGSVDFTITFDAPVTIDADGTYVMLGFDWEAFQAVKGVVSYEGAENNTVWNFTVAADVVKAAIEEYGTSIAINVKAIGPDGEFVEYNDSETIGINYIFAEPAEVNTVTLSFTGVEDAYAFLQAYDVNAEEEVLLNENTLTLSYEDELLLNLALREEYAEQGYTFYITSNLAEGEGIWSQQGVSADDANQIMVAFWEGANGTTFDVVVVEPAQADNTVTLTFSGVEDAFTYMNVYNATAEEEITLTTDEVEFAYGNELILSLSLKDEYAEQDYTFMIVSNLVEAEGVWQQLSVSADDLTQVMVGFWEGANGSTFDVVILEPDFDGIANIVGAQDGRYVVYNMNGVLLLDTENAADLNLLEGGLYIVNGKKVLIRK